MSYLQAGAVLIGEGAISAIVAHNVVTGLEAVFSHAPAAPQQVMNRPS